MDFGAGEECVNRVGLPSTSNESVGASTQVVLLALVCKQDGDLRRRPHNA